MKSRTKMWKAAVCLLAVFPITVPLAAQVTPSPNQTAQHHKYRLVDLGTLGGPNSQVNGAPPPMLNNEGTVAGEADTSSLCSYFDGFVSPAFRWQRGKLIDMGLLPGGCFSLPNSINSKGMMAGSGDIGLIDPQTGLPEIRADFRYKGRIINLGTFGGTNSLAGSVNSSGQVTGFAENTDPDPWNFAGLVGLPSPTAWHAFRWLKNKLHDLGTLGGPDSGAGFINNNDQIVGDSFTNDTPNPVTGIPTLDPFFWSQGMMTDVGTLGGTFGFGNALNNLGQVVGFSDLAGDLVYHAFFWENGVLTDIKTLGGPNSSANWINEAGQVVGTSDLTRSTHHAFIWQKGGAITDLGTIGTDPCSNGFFINASGQVIGTTTDCQGTILHTFLWEMGSMVDISDQVLPGSGFTFVEPVVINDSGEIVGNGGLPSGDMHAVLLKPTTLLFENNAEETGEVNTIASTLTNSAVKQNSMTSWQEAPVLSPLDRLRHQIRQHYHIPGRPGTPMD